MLWIGLTGGICTGKSTAAQMIRDQGLPVVDADEIAHQALRPEATTYAQIVSLLGGGIVSSSGELCRQKIADIVFTDANQLRQLEGIIHPFVQEKVAERRRKHQAQGHKASFYDVPLLFEKSLQDQFDQTLLIYCPQEMQKERMLARNGYSAEEIDKRLAAQLPIEQKKSLATETIENMGTREQLQQKIAAYLNGL